MGKAIGMEIRKCVAQVEREAKMKQKQSSDAGQKIDTGKTTDGMLTNCFDILSVFYPMSFGQLFD